MLKCIPISSSTPLEMLMNIRQQFGPLDASPQPNQTVPKHKKNSAKRTPVGTVGLAPLECWLMI